MASKPRKQTVLEMQIVVDADAAEMERTLQFVITSLKGANRNLKKDVAAVSVLIYDDNGVEIGADTTGTLSPAANDLIAEIKKEMAQEATPI